MLNLNESPMIGQDKLMLVAARSAAENKKNTARAGLIDFACYIDKAAQQWYRAAHLRTIASVLERVERGELKRVIVSVPPRHWKSSLASVKFPAWWLGKHPDSSIIIASYNSNLAEKYSKNIKDTITSNSRYKQLFDIKIRRDSNRADDWLLETGYQTTLRAVGTGGGIAGYGFKLALLDDVSDPNKQSSPTETENDWEWYKNVIRTRAEPDAAIVVVNNRTGPNDVVGYLLDEQRNDSADPPGVWEYVVIPALDVVSGSFLWVDRFGKEYYQSLQNDPHLWDVQYQQQPSPATGRAIKREWFEWVPRLPEGAGWKVRAWDCAFSEKQSEKHDPDYTASVKACVWNDVLYLGEPRLFRKSIEDTAQEIVVGKMGEVGVRYGVGKVAIKASIVKAMNAAGFGIEEYAEKGDKVGRASAWVNRASQGYVKLVGTEKEWEAFCGQWWSFPSGAHDDAVDAVSGVAEMLRFHWVASPKREREKGPYEFVDKM